jgi:type I restriction enzyme S subunit
MMVDALPPDWEVKKIRELHAGGVTNLTPTEYSNEHFEYYSIPAYQEGILPPIVRGKEILSQKLLIPSRCLLFGKLNPRVEKVWNVESSGRVRCLASTEWLPIVPADEFDQHFGYYLLWSNWVLPVAQGLVSGSTPSRQRVEPTSFYDIEVPLPPIDEQREIGALLKRFQAAVSAQDDVVKAAQNLKRAAMRELFTRGLGSEAQKETEIGLVPESWDIAALDDCSFVQTGAAKGRSLGDAEIVEMPYLRVANVQDGRLDLTEMKTIPIRRGEVERYRLHDGDVVLTEGGDFDKLGRGFIWRGQVDQCVHQNHIFAVRTDRGRLLPEFFAYQAQSPYGKAYFLKVAHKTTNLACINSTKLKAFPVLLPPLGDQREVVGILDAIDQTINLHRTKRAVLDDLFKALLHKLMTGEIRVGDLDPSALTLTRVAEAAQ